MSESKPTQTSPETSQQPIPEAVATALLAIAALAIGTTLFCATGWYRAATSAGPGTERLSLEQLSVEDRQKLVDQFLDVAARVYYPAAYATGVGYTLAPDKDLESWNSTFRSNKLGYRSHRVRKKPGVFRIVFVGDSWTYGMGVDWRDSFPMQLEEIANRVAGSDQRIEAWTLALPGYNLINQISALEAFWTRLQPDAVIFCPTTNDNSSSHRVMSTGSATRNGVTLDDFGDDHSIIYRMRMVDSFKYWQRWGLAMGALDGSLQRLQDLGIPAYVFFVAAWEQPFVHYLMDQMEVSVPYAVVPKELTEGEFRGPEPWKHGTPAAYQGFAEVVYHMVAPGLGWQPLEPSSRDLAIFDEVPEGRWRVRSEDIAHRSTSKAMGKSYRPGPGQRIPCAGPMDCVNGLIGRATTVQVLRTSDSLTVTLRPLEDAPVLYPLNVEVAIPSAGGGTRVETVLSHDAVQRVTVPVPADIPQKATLDVEIRVARTTLAPDVLAERSLFIESIEPN